MTALPLLTVKPRPQIPAPYIPVSIAADKLGVDPGHLARKCRAEYADAGLARQFGRNWGIHPSVDLRLQDVEVPDVRDRRQLAELARAGASRRHLAVAEARRDIVLRFESFSPSGIAPAQRVAAFIAELLADETVGPQSLIKKVSQTTLYKWGRLYRDAGLDGLVRKVAERAQPAAIGEAALNYMRALLLAGNNITVRSAWLMAQGAATKHADAPDWRIPSYRTVLLHFKRTIPRILHELANKGERSAIANCVPKAQRDFDSIPSNAEWVGDERTVDVMIRIRAARGWQPCRKISITGWIDQRSRVLVGWLIKPYADTATILGSLKRGILAWGKPAILRVDWGRDYRSATGVPKALNRKLRAFDGPRLASVLDELGIAVRPVTPYTPWAKLIESFFDTMKNRNDKLYGSFWGGSPSERHEDRQAWVKKNLEKLPTLDEFVGVFEQFIDTYHRTPHGAPDLFGKSPSEAMEEFREGPPVTESPGALNFLLQQFVGPKFVRRDGIRHNNRWYGHGVPQVVAMQGRRVLLAVQPDDISRAWVCALDRTPIIEVECASLRGFSHRDAKDIARAKSRLLRPYRDQVKAARIMMAGASPSKLAADYDAGIRSLHGDRVPAESTPPNLRVRPALEKALAGASRGTDEARSSAVRTGTDDCEITMDDLLGDDEAETLLQDGTLLHGGAAFQGGTGVPPVNDDIDIFGIEDD